MVATLKVDQIETVNGTGTIIVPTGVKLAGTDTGSIYSPGGVVKVTRWTSSNFNGSTTSTSFVTLDTLSLTATPGNLIYVTGDFPTRGSGSGWYLTMFGWNDAADGNVWESGYQGVNGSEGIVSQTLSFSYTWSAPATHNVSMLVKAYNSTRYYGASNQTGSTTTPVITFFEIAQ